MEQRSFLALGPHGFHRLAYTSWGSESASRTIVCVHGLTRNSRDFDSLASALCAEYRVVCPDMPGRGLSDCFSHSEDYQYPVYLQACAALLAHLNTEAIDWIGTSMGGLIGMMLAAQPGTPIGRLILNDIGARIPGQTLTRIGAYIGHTGPFHTLADLEQRLRAVHAPFGNLTDEQWHHLATYSHWGDGAGGFRLAYDPAIAEAFSGAEMTDIDLRPVWSAVRCPVLLVRGEHSDLLPAAVAQEMMAAHPACDELTVAEAGHAPALMASDQILALQAWLRQTPPL